MLSQVIEDGEISFVYDIPNQGDFEPFMSPGTFFSSTGLLNVFSQTVVMTMPDATDCYVYASLKVPTRASHIIGATLYYVRENAGDLYMRFLCQQTDISTLPSDLINDYTDALTVYNCSTADNKIASIEIPAGVFDDLDFDEGDIISIVTERNSVNALDTYNGTLRVIGIKLQFT